MTAGSILVGIATLILVVFFVGRPLLIPKTPQVTYHSKRLLLLQQKAALLAHIQSLDFDHETGKMPTDLYEPQRVQLVKEAAGLMERLEKAASTPPTGNGRTRGKAIAKNGSRAEIDAKIEAAISRLRETPVVHDSHVADGKKSDTGASHFCPQCGSSADAAAIFCSNCGHKLKG